MIIATMHVFYPIHIFWPIRVWAAHMCTEIIRDLSCSWIKEHLKLARIYHCTLSELSCRLSEHAHQLIATLIKTQDNQS